MILRTCNIFAHTVKEVECRVCIHSIKSIYKVNHTGGGQPTVEREHVYLQYHKPDLQAVLPLPVFRLLVKLHTSPKATYVKSM